MSETSKNDNFTNDILSLWIHEKEIELSDEEKNDKVYSKTNVWSVGDDYILKMSNSEEDIKHKIYVSQLLLNEGIPVPKVIGSLEGNTYIKINNKFYALFTKIKGEALFDYYKGNYIARAYYLGKCLGKLHKALEKITDNLDDNYMIYDNYTISEVNTWGKEDIDEYLKRCNLPKKDMDTFNKIYLNIIDNFEKDYKKLPRQIIHRDFHGQNIIFNNGRLAGYTDFDLNEKNARLYDLCYLCTGAFASCFDNLSKRKKWPSFARKVILGYRAIVEMNIDEEKSIKNMLYMIQLIMMKYFIKNNYEYIADVNIKMINYISEVW